jgi:hypothetical protein
MEKLIPKVNYNEERVYYISVSDIKAKFIPVYDTEFWTAYFGLKSLLGFPNTEEGKKQYSKWLFSKGYLYKNQTVEAIKNICVANGIDWNKVKSKQISTKNTWDKNYNNSRDIGNLFHAYKDNTTFKEREELFKLLNQRDSNGLLTYDLWQLPDGIYTELTIYNNKHLIIGRIDWLQIKTLPSGERMVDIDDHKTHKKVELHSKYMLLKPLNHLPNTEYYVNAIQLNLYAFILISWGFKINSIKFTNYIIPDTSNVNIAIPTEYKVPNLQAEISLMLKHIQDEFKLNKRNR